jgi:NADPH2:quinone reductase
LPDAGAHADDAYDHRALAQDDDHAAAFLAGAGYLVGYLVLTEFVAFKPAQSVLAPGIGGAVGMESVQIARKLGASLAISNASTSAKAEKAQAHGYGCEASVNLTDIIWKPAKVRGFTFRGFAPETLVAAQKALIGYLSAGAIQPTIAKVFPLSDAADAVRHLIEERPFGRVLMRVED